MGTGFKKNKKKIEARQKEALTILEKFIKSYDEFCDELRVKGFTPLSAYSVWIMDKNPFNKDQIIRVSGDWTNNIRNFDTFKEMFEPVEKDVKEYTKTGLCEHCRDEKDKCSVH